MWEVKESMLRFSYSNHGMIIKGPKYIGLGQKEEGYLYGIPLLQWW